MLTAVLTYWFAALAFGIVGMPAARLLFGALPDRGYAFARTVGLLLTGYLAWLAAMFGLASFGAPLIVVAALAVLIGGVLALHRVSAEAASPAVALRWVRRNWGIVVFYEALFAAALIFLALLRAQEYGFVGPHPWGTERPMDYAFFNAIRVSAVFPPHDPWMSGYSINYYYFGYLLMAAVSLVTGVHPAVGYNMSLALTFALTALGIAGLISNLVALATSQFPDAPRATDVEVERADADATPYSDGMASLSRMQAAFAVPLDRGASWFWGMRRASAQQQMTAQQASTELAEQSPSIQASADVEADMPDGQALPNSEGERAPEING
ncbi:MAG: hypothetical protein C0183_21565, partial [Roseiflexus castenholzii]